MENKEPDSWKKALDGAESEPSAGVWSAIESDLIAAENVKMKRSIVLYQRLAAAAIAFAILAGSYSLYVRRNESASDLNTAQRTDSKKTETKTDVPAQTPAEANKVTPAEGSQGVITSDGITESSASPQNDRVARHDETEADESAATSPKVHGDRLAGGASNAQRDPLALASPTGKTGNDYAQDKGVKSVTGSTANPKSGISETDEASRSKAFDGTGAALADGNTETTANSASPDLVALEKQRLAAALSADSAMRAGNALVESPIKIKQPEKTSLPWEQNQNTIIPKRNDSRESLWASVGAAAGVYSPGAKASNLSQFQSSSNSKTVGPAWSFGASVAGKISDHWVVQGGVNYLNQSIGSSPGLMASVSGPPVANKNTFSDYSQAYSAIAMGTAPALTSTLEFISLPVQAGYLVIDRKLGFMVNAGVSSNFFVRNSIQDQNGEMAAFSAGAGADSPYRTITWSGLMSTELSYRVAQQYRFSLVPGMRYALNSQTKAGGDRPYVMDIGFRVRYNFN